MGEQMSCGGKGWAFLGSVLRVRSPAPSKNEAGRIGGGGRGFHAVEQEAAPIEDADIGRLRRLKEGLPRGQASNLVGSTRRRSVEEAQSIEEMFQVVQPTGTLCFRLNGSFVSHPSRLSHYDGWYADVIPVRAVLLKGKDKKEQLRTKHLVGTTTVNSSINQIFLARDGYFHATITARPQSRVRPWYGTSISPS